MYTLQQMQAADYLLKTLLNRFETTLLNKNLKFVIEVNNSYWYGDFINFQGEPIQEAIDDYGHVDSVRYYPDSSKATVF